MTTPNSASFFGMAEHSGMQMVTSFNKKGIEPRMGAGLSHGQRFVELGVSVR